MAIFWRLMFGHLLSDFTFQTNFINRWKRSSVYGMLAHCLTHPVAYIILTWPYLGEPWVDLGFLKLNGWTCVALVFVAHFIEDYWRVFTIFKYNTPDNTLYFIWDQVIHYAVIFAVIPVSMRGGPIDLFPEKWPILGCLFVLVTHACTVLVYFIEKDLYDKMFPDTQEKYLTMLERLILALCFLVPGNFFPILAVGWLSVMHYMRVKRYVDFSRFGFALGATVAVLCGLAARYIWYYT